MLASFAGRLALLPDLAAAILRHWTAHRRRRASQAVLERLLARGDDRLLDDVGLDRPAALRLIGETLYAPHRSFDRWQL